MGCDIHMFLEKKLRDSDPWVADEGHGLHSGNREYVREISPVNRDYELFGLIAGVRSFKKSIYSVKGVPKDCDPRLMAHIAYYGNDYHSATFLSLDQFSKVLKKAGYIKKPEDVSTQVFYEYAQLDITKWPKPYITILNYANEWIDNETAEAVLLNRSDIKPQVRLIIFFDS